MGKNNTGLQNNPCNNTLYIGDFYHLEKNISVCLIKLELLLYILGILYLLGKIILVSIIILAALLYILGDFLSSGEIQFKFSDIYFQTEQRRRPILLFLCLFKRNISPIIFLHKFLKYFIFCFIYLILILLMLLIVLMDL